MQTRRSFLNRSLALGCTAAASPLITPVSFAATPGENRLVVIVLRGAMDGLDVVRPLGDPHITSYRPGLGADDSLVLNDFFGLHPALEPLFPLWRSGELSFAHAVSTPYRYKRSHLDGQDILEAGVSGEDIGTDGWLNRMVSLMPDAHAETAFAIGRENMRLLLGPAPNATWAPDSDINLSPQAQLMLKKVYAGD
ncbi:MAG: twin-arginine translocation pathway signal, partial [Pseudomonadota bacterium]